MFERFTRQARDTVIEARTQARQLRHDTVGPEHLLLGVLLQPGAPGVAALHRLGVTEERVRDQVTQHGSGTRLGPADADALQTLGIDLDEVKRKVEDSFGSGALDPAPPRRRRWWPGRHRTGHETLTNPGFAPRAKHALQYALRQAIARKDRHIGAEHILLGVLAFPDSAAVQLLNRLGVTATSARQEILSDLDTAA